MKREKSVYHQYVRELEQLKHSGCGLYYPENVKISPKKMAALMVQDEGVTYMRDPSYDEKGRVVKIQFYRVDDAQR